MSRWKQFAILLLVAYSTPALHAQTIIAPSGRTIFRGASLVRTTLEVYRSSLDSGGQKVSATKYVPVVMVVYGFRPKWSFIAAQPYAGVRITSRTPGMVAKQGFSGLADTRLFVQYDGLYSRNSPGGLTRLSGVFGLQAPSGSSRITTGALAYTTGLIFEKAVRLNYVFSADSEYTFATANGRGIATGDIFRFDGAVARFVIPKTESAADAGFWKRAFHKTFRNGAYFILEMNGQWQGSNSVHGQSVPNTGGTTVSLSPGIQYFMSNSLLAEFSTPIPVLRNLDGVQLKPNTSFVAGFRYLF